MNVIVELLDKKATLKVEGRLDTITAPDLEKKINELSINELVLDLNKLDYISSAGLRVILTAHKKFSKLQSMKVVNVKEAVMEVFNMTGFSDILNIE